MAAGSPSRRTRPLSGGSIPAARRDRALFPEPTVGGPAEDMRQPLREPAFTPRVGTATTSGANGSPGARGRIVASPAASSAVRSARWRCSIDVATAGGP